MGFFKTTCSIKLHSMRIFVISENLPMIPDLLWVCTQCERSWYKFFLLMALLRKARGHHKSYIVVFPFSFVEEKMSQLVSLLAKDRLLYDRLVWVYASFPLCFSVILSIKGAPYGKSIFVLENITSLRNHPVKPSIDIALHKPCHQVNFLVRS